MRRFLFALGIVLLFPYLALAGPNAGTTWTHDGINTTGYTLEWSKNTNFLIKGSLEFPANQRSAVVEGLDWNQTYSFRLTAKGPGGETVSDVVAVTTPEEPVGPPSKPVLRIEITVTNADGTISTFKLASIKAE